MKRNGKVKALVVGAAKQPVSTVEWVDPALLRANDYNPNHVAPPEMALLKVSILENGWTQPIVTRTPGSDGIAEIVDGFHRYSLIVHDADVRAMTDGLAPVVRLAATDPVTQRMATIRHNRARGTHAVVKMADIVDAIKAMGEDEASIGRRLGMDPEEVKRLLMRGGMNTRGGKDFNHGWVPGTLEDKAAATGQTEVELRKESR